MTMNAKSNVHTFDRRLLARMTGNLGDDQTVGKLAEELGQVFSEFLPDILNSETQQDITITYAGFESGLMSKLVTNLGDGVGLCNVGLRNWCQDFILGIDSPAIIGLVEMLLGASASEVEESKPRQLSDIELDVAAMVFEKIAEVLKTAVNAPGGFEPVLGRPFNAGGKPSAVAEEEDVFAACINISIGLGPILSTFSIIVPQQPLLKTTIVFPKGTGQNRKAKTEWGEQLEQQVRRSNVNLEARIKLQSLTLNAVSRLQPGDVIPFHDAKDVRVEVNANGRDLYICEFGRSGARYTVRIKDTHGSDNDILNHLMS
jgi:flagellar motor switch protein FliM